MRNINNTIKELMERKSTRIFDDKEISLEIKRVILECACNAPTAGNQQMYTIIDVTDQKIKDELVKTCDNQAFIAKAKMVLVFCADIYKWYNAFKETDSNPRNPGVGDLMISVSDALIAAQNAVTAAESLGIGSCYIGDIMENYERQRELLCLPEYVFPCAMLVFGYPTKNQTNIKKPLRAPLSKIVSENRYNIMSPEEREEMFQNKLNGKSYKEWMNAFCNRKYNSDFSKEMTRSVNEYIKQFDK